MMMYMYMFYHAKILCIKKSLLHCNTITTIANIKMKSEGINIVRPSYKLAVHSYLCSISY